MTAPAWRPVDDDTQDLLSLISDDPRVEADYQRFLTACQNASVLDGLVRVNHVRDILTDANGDLVIHPQRLSSFWNKATGRNKPMVLERDAKGDPVWQVCKGSRSGNDGRPQPVRRWVGEAS